MSRSFSIRIPDELEAVISSRASISRRSRNSQIIVLLEAAIDLLHGVDIDTITVHEKTLTRAEQRRP